MTIELSGELLGSCRGEAPEGCKYCDQGAKMVLYITGICKQECYYCPLSEKKKDRDVVYANERLVEGMDWLDKVIDEATRMNALGSGITGGDPLVVPERTARVIRRLKEEFGEDHHVHLYTTGPFDPVELDVLQKAGLDEIRFHPPIHTWNSFRHIGEGGEEGDGSEALPYHDLIMRAKEVVSMVGLEIPAVIDEMDPKRDNSEGLHHLVRYGIRIGLDFININELEASHTNMPIFMRKGFELVGDSMAVMGSRELAWSVIERLREEFPDSNTTLHFCSSIYKDSIQLRNRLIRMAENLKRDHDVVTRDGTFIRGVILTDDVDGIVTRLREEYEVPDELMEAVEGKIIIAPWILEEIGPELQETTYLSEVYPTWDGLEVERIPIE